MKTIKNHDEDFGTNQYAFAFKKQVVDQIENGLISKRQASIKYLVSRSSIDYWCKQYGDMKKGKSQQDEIKKLKDRIEELEFVKEFQQDVFIEIEKLGGDELVKKLLPKQLYEELQKRKKSK